jgi:fibronectin type 3 domain-containing protein
MMSVVPLPPTNLAIGSANTTLTLVWEFSLSTDVTAYNVYRGANFGGPYTKIGSSPGNSSSFTDNTYQSGGTYYYVVTAVGASGVESVFSNQVNITP